MMAALKQLRNSTWPGDIQRQSRRNHQDVKMVIVKNMVWWTSLFKHVLHQSLLRTEVALLMFRRMFTMKNHSWGPCDDAMENHQLQDNPPGRLGYVDKHPGWKGLIPPNRHGKSTTLR